MGIANNTKTGTGHSESTERKYRCWISSQDKILSFSFVDGYEFKEFDTYADFQDYYYRKTYWGYRAK